ncbi:hypothetical protein [Nocardia blacklockiae]|uniref:hypothetical protein n=1 Tax=Nocardia blacklockiae TaxID=480036 RepID=UPI0018942ACC|nr:hypothetical protein [Nocardia blacklockiae]MBF6175158.1 hypothetical protein [Nocardia blacklockiae]
MENDTAYGPPRRVVHALSRTEALRLLASVSWGRLIFAFQAVPATCLATHYVTEDGGVVVRAGLTAPATTVVRPGRHDHSRRVAWHRVRAALFIRSEGSEPSSL